MFNIFQENVFSDSKCLSLLELAKNYGFEKALVNIYGKQQSAQNIRNNERIEFENTTLAVDIQSVLQEKIMSFPYEYKEKIFSKAATKLRFYKYTPGQYFKPHKDGHFRNKEEESLITVLVYLNDTEGGETILMPDGFSKKESWITIYPKKGSVLMFDHDFWHEGRPVHSGEKIVFRTDLMFK